MRIAIIDDSPTFLELTRSVLEEIPGCEVTVFSDARAGLEWCLTSDPDLVLLDYVMPKMDGIRFVRSLRRDARGRELPVLMITGRDDKAILEDALRAGATDFLRKSADRGELLARVRNLLRLRQSRRLLAGRAEWLATEVHKVTTDLLARERETIMVLSRAAEFRDNGAEGHLRRIALLSRILADGLGMATAEVELIGTAAPMHDVGKIGVPDRVLLKPGPLDEDEWTMMRRHPEFGAEILTGESRLLAVAREIALSHHERWDGDGYPHHLSGCEIPPAGRITAVADVFDALASKRPYKAAWDIETARDHVLNGAGSQFDPECVAVFSERWPEIRAVATGGILTPTEPRSPSFSPLQAPNRGEFGQIRSA